MKSYVPVSPEDNAFDFICPYMMLWDVKELGAIALKPYIFYKGNMAEWIDKL